MGGGTTEVKQQASYDPTLQALQTLRANLSSQLISGGIPAGLSGVLQNVVIPNTVNTMTSSGLGRSGAMGEAVSQASLGSVTGLLQSLLTGLPSAQAGGTSTSGYSPGGMDYAQAGIGLLAAMAPLLMCWIARAIYGGECLQVSLVRAWIMRHRWVKRLYLKFGSSLVPVAWMFKPLTDRIVRRAVRAMARA